MTRSIEELDQEIKRLSGILSGWTGVGNEAYFDFLRAKDGFFDKPILQFAELRRSGTTQTMTNNANTAIQWDRLRSNNGIVSRSFSTATDSSKITIAPHPSEQREYLIFGAIELKSGTTGVRESFIEFTTLNGSTGSAKMNNNDAIGGHNETFAYPLAESKSSGLDWFKIEVFQNNGANLGLIQARVAILRVF